MKHLKQFSLGGSNYESGDTTPLEQLIIVVLSVYFNDWANFSSVIQNLSKFYSKT
jgi:hypothetical protein